MMAKLYDERMAHDRGINSIGKHRATIAKGRRLVHEGLLSTHSLATPLFPMSGHRRSVRRSDPAPRIPFSRLISCPRLSACNAAASRFSAARKILQTVVDSHPTGICPHGAVRVHLLMYGVEGHSMRRREPRVTHIPSLFSGGPWLLGCMIRITDHVLVTTHISLAGIMGRFALSLRPGFAASASLAPDPKAPFWVLWVRPAANACCCFFRRFPP